MKSYRFKNIIHCGFILASVALSCVAGTASSLTKKPLVAITQIVPHPSLNLIRQGIEDELAMQKIDCDFLFENAQGNMATATQIAQKFVSQKPAVIVPITTPSTQTVYTVAKGYNIPVIFAAVNDPVGAKLVPSLDKAGQDITGVSDLPPVAEQISLLQEILPNAKRVGTLYNPGESNSLAVLDIFEKDIGKKGMTLVRATASNMVEVTAAARSLIGKVDVIYIPNDNTIVAALESLLKVAKINNIPIISSDPESVKQGCLATIAHCQYGLGRQTGKMVAKVLKGVNLQTLSVETPAQIEVTLNQETAQELKIEFPSALLKRSKTVIQK